MTSRTLENGRLFPPMIWDHGWSLSIQADKAGYQCSPKKRLDTLEEYETVEVKIDGPHGTTVDPYTMQMPDDVKAKFPVLEIGDGPSIGGNLTWEDVECVKNAILYASLSPNDGAPDGEENDGVDTPKMGM
ncbi:hypothetical protein [Mesorhizobium sp. SP-1A]|uniref:hypothetical protein n=1 Tax=Mesorhizobium sp. SP-1A TaxID=3077840 RepID=UPI0028F6C23F|nr:hypothetical protein [Mesorhizobium sp. SP-1A]